MWLLAYYRDVSAQQYSGVDISENLSTPLRRRVLAVSFLKTSTPRSIKTVVASVLPSSSKVLTETFTQNSVLLSSKVPAATFPETSALLSSKVTAATFPEMHTIFRPLILNQAKLLYTYNRTTKDAALRLKTKLVRNFMRRHDYKVYARLPLLFQLQFVSVFPSTNQLDSLDVKVHMPDLDPMRGGGKKPDSDLPMKKSKTWTYQELFPYLQTENHVYQSTDLFAYIEYLPADQLLPDDPNRLCADIPVDVLFKRISAPNCKVILTKHGIDVTRQKISLAKIQTSFAAHQCTKCPVFLSHFKQIFDVKKAKNAEYLKKSKAKHSETRKTEYKELTNKRTKDSKYKEKQATLMRKKRAEFPPPPPTSTTIASIIRGFCDDIHPNLITESGCAVCGMLYGIKSLKPLDSVKLDFTCLNDNSTKSVTRKERRSMSHPRQFISGPILDNHCKYICVDCFKAVSLKKIPHKSLANGLWIGDIPPELQDLSWTEKMLISRVTHNYCVVRFSMSGMKGLHKLKANAISFSVPMPKVYKVLPPKREDLDDVLAFIYIGPVKPTTEDWKRTPFLVRHNKVKDALDWLKLNHEDYTDLEISEENLKTYSETEPPVIPDWHKSDIFEDKEAKAVTSHREEEIGVEEGKCPFVVHGITGSELSQLEKSNPQKIRGMAIKRFKSDGYMLGIGHNSEPETLFNNAQLYPQMFPWLFPYGMGGVGNKNIEGRMSTGMRKKCLLMYHDKRFQLDPLFSLIAFNHEQIKKATTGGYLLANKDNFDQISSRLLNIRDSVLTEVIEKLEKGYVRTDELTPEEQEC